MDRHDEVNVFYVHDRKVPMSARVSVYVVFGVLWGCLMLRNNPALVPLPAVLVLVGFCYEHWTKRASRDILISAGEKQLRISYGGEILVKEWAFEWSDFDFFSVQNETVQLHFRNTYIPRPPIVTAQDRLVKTLVYIGDISLCYDFKMGDSGESNLSIPHLSTGDISNFSAVCEKVGIEERKALLSRFRRKRTG